MRGNYKYSFLFFILALGYSHLAAQPVITPDSTVSNYIIGEITITGNKKTRDEIILRELSFHKGESFTPEELTNRMEAGRKQLMNTALFHQVLVAAKDFNGNTINIQVDVKERWYLFPVPYFKPVDRNINQWLVEQCHRKK